MIYRRSSKDSHQKISGLWATSDSPFTENHQYYSWTEVSTVISATNNQNDLANCMLYQIPESMPSSAANPTTTTDGIIVAAYRHHINPYGNGTWGQYRIMTKRSRDGLVSAQALKETVVKFLFNFARSHMKHDMGKQNMYVTLTHTPTASNEFFKCSIVPCMLVYVNCFFVFFNGELSYYFF